VHEIVKQRAVVEATNSSNEHNSCCICKENPKSMLLLPCRHICLCEECGENFHNGRLENCPVCRQMIRDILRVYI
jgi:RING finger protein 26